MADFNIFGTTTKKRKQNLFGYNGDLGFGPEKRPKNTRRAIDKPTRDAVWIKYMGNKSEGKCYCCRIRPIHITDFQVGHNRAVAKGGKDNISNLRPICGPCNRGMGTISIEQYKSKYFGRAKAPKPKRPSKKKSKPYDPFAPPKIKKWF